MNDQQDKSQRTQEATPKRLEDARKRGDAPKSQEVTTTFMLGAGALALWLFSGSLASGIAKSNISFIDHPHAIQIDASSLQQLFVQVVTMVGGALAGLGILLFVAAILANIVQARPVFTTHRMKPSWNKISPLSGLSRIFGPSGLVNFAKGLGKLLIIGLIMGISIWLERDIVINLLYTEDLSVIAITRIFLLKLVLLVVLAMTVIAGLDFAWQRYSWKKRLRMTHEELRREQKETEGDPQIKARQRQLRDAKARSRMTSALKEATVVIMNPTHYAVALKYEAGVHNAPICTAKGMNELALRMRAIAREHNVPVIENPPLARALHAGAALDQEIPLEQYEAVAKVIGFIMAKSPSAAPSGPAQ